MRLALLLVAIDPGIGGVLIQGAKGTAKSTMVRSLAALLPSGRLRTLALGATEDRLVGGLDLEPTLTGGSPRFMSGLLAESDGGILYVDEVNLLADHLVDLVLDAAASGVVVTEREGFSHTQPARFALVGTMNPEEGALRPQLLDRFGLCVTTAGTAQLADRVEILSRRLAFDADPGGFAAAWDGAEQEVAARLSQARTAAPSVKIGPELTGQITTLATDAQVAGHRADLVMTRAARAHAAWCGRGAATPEDLDVVAELALTHRRRHLKPPEPASPQIAPPPQPADAPPPDSPAGDSPAPTGQPASELPAEEVFGIGEAFAVRPLDVGADRRRRAGAGRRAATVNAHDRGRYIRSRPTKEPRDLALDATLRASAVHQRQRRRRAAERGDPRTGLAILIEPADWRRKVRARQVGSLVVLCVDASSSMGARNRMVASKGAVLSLLLDAYVKRDQVALVSFRGSDARVLVPPTSSIDTAERRLRDLAVGGRTPLAAGLVAVGRVVRRALTKDPALRPLVILITDGRSNVTLAGQVSRAAGSEALEAAARLAHDERVTWVVVDSNSTGPAARGHSDDLARTLGAQRFTIHDLRAKDLVSMVSTMHQVRNDDEPTQLSIRRHRGTGRDETRPDPHRHQP